MKTDQQLKQDVTNELRWEPSVTEAHVGVTAKHGIVTLSGHVPTFGEMYGAEQAAKRVLGVGAVVNELEVRLTTDTKPNDEDIAEGCVTALRMHAAVPDDKIKIVVRDGWVNIDGTVDWQFQRAAAEDAIRYLIGVRGLTDNIQIMPHAFVADVKLKIEAALKRSAEIDAKHIVVEAHDGKVHLSGHVRSWAEREQAQHAAWSAPGVHAVKNEISISP